MWIDKHSAQYIVTLGVVHGLFPGDYLTVYDGDQKIAQVKVDTSFDVISYVHPLEKSANLFKNNYYRVTIE